MNRLINFYWKKIKQSDDKRKAGQTPPDGVKGVFNLNYAGDSKTEHLLDMFYPENATGRLPLIMDIHGGGWYYGDKELNAYYCMWLSKEGFAVSSMNYTLAGKATVSEQVNECFQALNYMYENADKLNIDKNNIYITGDSAGGHLTAMLAGALCDKAYAERLGVDSPVVPRAAGYVCPALEPGEMAAKRGFGIYFNDIFGKGYRTNGVYKDMNFSSHINKRMCPGFFVSAYGDFLAGQTKAGCEKLKENGVDAELFFYAEQQNKEHKLGHVFNVLNPEWDESQSANKAMCEFFKKHLAK